MKRLSELGIWQAQRDYYDELGVEAWSGEVPFYITSNPFIARTYAKIILRFIQDYLRDNPDAREEPFYVLELGAGSGQFSFYFLQAVKEIQRTLQLECSLCYVMTDFTESNVKFWSNHAALQPFLEEGALDFAIFDAMSSDTMDLHYSGQKIPISAIGNPITVVANYLFDSLPNDLFHLKGGKIHEVQIVVDDPSNEQLSYWQEVDFDYQQGESVTAPYAENYLNAVLRDCLTDNDGKKTLLPVAGLRLIRRFQEQSAQGVLLLTSDKGYDDVSTMDDESIMDLDFHGSFSMMVNYDAIARYCRLEGGDSRLQCPRDAILTGVFWLPGGESTAVRSRFSEFPETDFAIHETNSRFSPADYFNLYEHAESFSEHCDLDFLASLLCLSGWDPGLFDTVFDRITVLLEETEVDADVLRYLSENLHAVAEQYYFLPGGADTLYNLGAFYQEVEAYEDALRYYKRSREYFDESWSLLFNEATCYSELGDNAIALMRLQEALAMDPEPLELKETQEFFNKLKKSDAASS